jgi:hypothetical protein
LPTCYHIEILAAFKKNKSELTKYLRYSACEIRLQEKLNGDLKLNQIKVAIKQDFGAVDSIIFDAAITYNAIETQNKQKGYVH